LWAVVNVGLEEAALLVGVGVTLRVAGPWTSLVVVVVRPLREVVREFVTQQVRTGVLKVDDDELLMLIGRLQQGRLLVIRAETQDVAVLSLSY
jgi:hypothetical protein